MENINPIDDIINKDEEKLILIELSKIDGLQEYLRAIMARDMRLHFTCPKEQQDLTRGAYFRTEWLSKQIKNVSVDKA
ncbi:hypothetical protein M0R04_15405 [Candidatus Dojkabacteria bacterium]|jgi:hypothetical protein|nr:hypothetical protein [Candidatus Dojkabacteria bacterium]